jgi:hypothetical protein
MMLHSKAENNLWLLKTLTKVITPISFKECVMSSKLKDK